jgi:hypothetical protein
MRKVLARGRGWCALLFTLLCECFDHTSGHERVYVGQAIRKAYMMTEHIVSDTTHVTLVGKNGLPHWPEVISWCTLHFGVGDCNLNDSTPLSPTARWHMWSELDRMTFYFRYPEDATLFRLRWML